MTDLFKVLTNGRCTWDPKRWPLPIRREDGAWEPGAWVQAENGQSWWTPLTATPHHHYRRWAVVYATEYEAEAPSAFNEAVGIARVKRVRLTRPLTDEELRDHRIIRGGSLVADEGTWVVDGPVNTELSGTAHATVWEAARVVARKNARVTAYDGVHVEARDNAGVNAYGSARVTARDGAFVRAYQRASVRAEDHVLVTTGSNDVRVEAFGRAHVFVADGAEPLVTLRDEAARVEVSWVAV